MRRTTAGRTVCGQRFEIGRVELRQDFGDRMVALTCCGRRISRLQNRTGDPAKRPGSICFGEGPQIIVRETTEYRCGRRIAKGILYDPYRVPLRCRSCHCRTPHFESKSIQMAEVSMAMEGQQMAGGGGSPRCADVFGMRSRHPANGMSAASRTASDRTSTPPLSSVYQSRRWDTSAVSIRTQYSPLPQPSDVSPPGPRPNHASPWQW
jgi:hypothetical protein